MKMKRLMYYGALCLALCAALLWGCEKVNIGGEQPIPVPETMVAIAPPDLVFEAAGGKNTFSISCNGPWTLEDTCDWCTTDFSLGTINQTVTVMADANDGIEDRNTVLTVKVGDKTAALGVTQKGKDAITETVGGVSFKMVYVEKGTFMMGATEEQGSDAHDDEKPAHEVTLTKDYYIGECEVTQGLWKAVMGSNPSWFKKGDNYPVEAVSWNDIQTFLTKLNEKTGRTYALPTDAQWEFAARGGNKSKGYKYSGSNDLDKVGWYYYNSGASNGTYTTYLVKQKTPNELGIYDMSGNVWEWCQDWYSSSYSSGSQTDPTGPSSGSRRVTRGGSWDLSAWNCRVSNRSSNDLSHRNGDLGFRLVLVR